MTRARPTLDVSSCLLEPERFPLVNPLSWHDLFGDGREIELEVGSGKGLFLANSAREHPDRGYFGIEISKKYARLAAERAVKAGLTNVRVWPGDAGPVVGKLVPDASVAAVHVYFPDPWWKKRHKKRRVFTESLVASVLRILKPGGRLEVATDVEEYYEVIRALVAAEPRLPEQPAMSLREPEHDLDYLTNFERKFRIEGRPIHRASYRKSVSS
ncbi:tRNA (guanosine(46)-N7)-methyltransferase TrmB [Aquisphaera insulae]|uniref:tRNA (guanosine(46)-N7)-methyltransferase TrmB n=1 Tax=Aquisphaera insulae TaxID=2712864 RepID=UPI0013EA662D|nr:tRNA (guanosine(46)-N7)-methyltransferase TrmB [Aquisphaera insulae]